MGKNVEWCVPTHWYASRPIRSQIQNKRVSIVVFGKYPAGRRPATRDAIVYRVPLLSQLTGSTPR
jgi:hypothetical protein